MSEKTNVALFGIQQPPTKDKKLLPVEHCGNTDTERRPQWQLSSPNTFYNYYAMNCRITLGSTPYIRRPTSEMSA